MRELNTYLGEMEYDGLISDLTPKTRIGGRTIRRMAQATVLKRGTILARSSADGTVVVLGTEPADGETLTPDSILCDDVEVGTDADVIAAVYTAGCFNFERTHVADGYALTLADEDVLRKYGIVCKTALACDTADAD